MFVRPSNTAPSESSIFLEHYETDPRPTFCVDLASNPNVDHLQPVYANSAFSERRDLCAKINDIRPEGTAFRSWVIANDAETVHYQFDSTTWFTFTVKNRWRIVSTCPYGFILSKLGRSSLLSTKTTIVGSAGRDIQGEAQKENQPEARSTKRYTPHLVQIRRMQDALRQRTMDAQAQNWSSESDPALLRTTPAATQFEEDEFQALAALENQVVMAEAQSDQDQAMLAKELARKSVEASNVSIALEKFQRLSKMIDVGFFDYEPSGKLATANDAWYKMSGHPTALEMQTENSFMNLVHPDDAELVMQQWNELLRGNSVTFEMRWRHAVPPDAPPGTEPFDQWVVSACVPIYGADGKLDTIAGCTTDINHQKKSAEVAVQRAEALERAQLSETRFLRFAEASSTALFMFNDERSLQYCNERWFEMMRIVPVPISEMHWTQGFVEEDLPACKQAWKVAIESRQLTTLEVRLKKPWLDADGREAQTYVLASFFAEFTIGGEFKGCTASLTDISQLKWAEQLQRSRVQEALTAKRQQESFIDMTSHEMRNPLSAMVQCADTVLAAFMDLAKIPFQALLETVDAKVAQIVKESLEVGTDAVQTILTCAAHQKRIVDDVLTLSKLDSNLLVITPVRTRPITMIHEAMKMFEIEAQKAGVTLNLEVGSSFADLQIDWLMLDPSRTLQVLINLMTNAIKFTRGELVRTITVRLSASLNPTDLNSEIDFIPARTKPVKFFYGPEWGDGEFVYLGISLTDTGRGLAEDEKARLWKRFAQASPKTHVQYGGSGLGLFISRQLCELQGGEIGLASEANKGSTFAFFIKTRRTTGPNTFTSVTNNTPTNSYHPIVGTKRDKPLTVLVVEDNLVNQKVLTQQLVRLGCSVFTAGHGLEALEFLKTTGVWKDNVLSESIVKLADRVYLDTILMDTEMPIMGGLECTRQIRALEACGQLISHIPIISISANARSEQVAQALEAGVDDTVTKPFRMLELLPKIQRLANHDHG